MKKFWVLILTLISCFCIGMVASAAPGPPPPPPHHDEPHSHDRMKAERVLDVTRDYVFRAERVAHHYQQDSLRRAFYLQRQARHYYNQGRYRTTIRYSLRARDVAINIIETAHHPAPRHAPPPPPHHNGDASISIRLNL